MQALVIGGTGMLSDLVLWLSSRYQCVSVIGRNWSHLNSLVERAGSNADRIVPISVDYSDKERLVDAVRKNMWRNGPVDLVVAWVRSGYMNNLSAVAEEISSHSRESWRLFHVRGTLNLESRKIPELPENVLYREVILGFLIENGGSRWLTDDEIWQGVRSAIEDDTEFSVVGVTRPVDRMPQ